ncbi:MAG: ABC transporter substrate-binding protein [Dehalococcoidales bacterium]|nr:ABC transporter substrate-binding protein [Dehalococcoidales bacterium]
MKNQLYLFLVIVLLAGMLLGGCGKTDTPTPTTTTTATTPAAPTATVDPNAHKYGGTFIWVHNGGIPQIGGIADNLGFAAQRNTYPMFEGLLMTDEQDNIQPWLATSWDVSPDGKTIVFHLEENVKFHDGTNFDAAAAQFNLEAVLAANIGGTAFLNNIASYEIQDMYTLEINLLEVDSTFLLRLGQGILGLMASPTALQTPTTPETIAQVHSVGTGPFLFDSWERDSFVKYKKWDGYRKPGLPYLDVIEIRNTADLTVSIMSLQAGEIHAVENIDPVDAKHLGETGYTLYQPNLYFLHSVVPSGNNPDSPFAIKEVRLALEYAIDKKTIAAGVGMGYYEALNQLATQKDPWYNPDLAFREYDPPKARELLAQAGYPNGFSTTLVSDVLARRDTLTAIQTYLNDVGIKTELEILDFGAAFGLPRQGWEGVYFPGFPNVGTLLGIQGRWGDPSTYISIYQPAGYWGKWDALKAEMDPVKRTGILKDILKMIYDEAIGIPYQGDAPLVAMVPELHGFAHHAFHVTSFWSPGEVWLEKK